MKFRLFEFEDLSWFPGVIRQGMTDYLSFMFQAFKLYEPVASILLKTINESGAVQVLDLCSGGGGPVKQLQSLIKEKYGHEIKFVLSDQYPNLPAFQKLEAETKGAISFIGNPVNAMLVPPSVKGLRTIFSGFHHFDKNQAALVLKNAVDANEPIAIFDGGDKNVAIVLAILIGHPLLFIFLTPFFKPFRFSRLIFTYLIPLIPICTIWDGIISISRLHRPCDLLSLATEAGQGYKWQVGKVKNKFGMNIAYLTGIPQNK